MVNPPDPEPQPVPNDPIVPLLERILTRELVDQRVMLDRLCAEHPKLATRLRAAFDLADSLGQSTLSAALGSPPETIGPFKILDTLGVGGMGIVYLAEQTGDVRRQVALKVVKLGLDTKDVVARFELERRALAAMNHECIAKVFQVGTTEQGQPYFVMELVRGLPLTQYCDEQQLGIAERIELFQQVCAGVQHAHQKGIIHRDLKPANILVTNEGGKAVPKILDFGLAKATNSELHARTMHTARDQILGTPEYMSPEQASGADAIIDLRSDVYSLGVVLYELLVGVVPFSSQQLRSEGWLAMLRILAEVEPTKPSTKITTTNDSMPRSSPESSARGGSSVHRLARALRGDLDWITLRALAKEPERRYESAAALAEDLRRHLQFEPVMAGPPSASYRLQKLVRKYRVQFAAGAFVFLALVAGVVTSLGFYLRSERHLGEVEVRERALLTEQSETRRMADMMLLQQTRAKADDLWPLGAELVERIDGYLADCRPLLARLPDHERVLAAIEARAQPYTDAERERDHRQAREAIVRVKGEIPIIQRRLQTTKSTAQFKELLERRRRELSDLQAGLTRRTTWRFPEEEEFLAFRHSVFARLVAELGKFSDPEKGTIGSVQRRRERSQQTVERTLVTAEKSWQRCIARVAANQRYRGLRLVPQEGLLPLGADPESTFEEFLHWPTHAPGHPMPRRGPDDKLPPMDGKTGMILVLLPGGKVFLGASNKKGRPNYDKYAHWSTRPSHEVALDPFFIAKHELTRGQWGRISGGRDPSKLTASHFAELSPDDYLRLPIDSPTWFATRRELHRAALVIPTESRWEYACRAGTESVYSWGEDWRLFVTHANLADDSFHKVYGRAKDYMRGSDDGFASVAPVGSFLPNAFGLHDVHGNVSEWCLDRSGPYGGGTRPGDGMLVKSAGTELMIYRGGCIDNDARSAQSHTRSGENPYMGRTILGVRAARDLER